MPRLLATPCSNRSCPNLKPCPIHVPVRATRQQRGYDRGHERLRARWLPIVELGQADCHAVTCVMPARRILLGQTWDLGHTKDRKGWTGPEHSRCNRSAGGKAAHGKDH